MTDKDLKAKLDKSLSDWQDDPRALQSAQESYNRAAMNPDVDPETLEQLRFRYYSMKNGPAWADQERKVIVDSKMNPVLDAYRQQYDDLDNQAAVQAAYTDSIAIIRNKQSSLKDSVMGNIDYLGNLLSEKLQKIGAFNRYIQLTDPTTATPVPPTDNPMVAYFASFPPSFATILDVFIAILILLMLIIIFRTSGIAFTGFGNFWRQSYYNTQPGIPNIKISSPGLSPINRAV
jgi:hypothetical protein